MYRGDTIHNESVGEENRIHVYTFASSLTSLICACYQTIPLASKWAGPQTSFEIIIVSLHKQYTNTV